MQNSYDVIIIGGGAAGIMAAISAKKNHPEYSVALFDRTFALGRKILVCGAGRCNITNINLSNEVSKRYYGASTEFIQSIFTQFGYENIVEFFEDLGIELYVERKTTIGKLFPVTDQAKTVTSLLEDELQRIGVDIFLNHDCTKIKKNSENFQLQFTTTEKHNTPNLISEFNSKYLVLSAGGKTYPALGSNGSGYNLAEALGHKIVTPVPSALPLEGKNPLSQELQGVKLELEATSIIEGNAIKSSIDDVMFAQYGLSGPAILNISREISIQINRYNKGNVFVNLNFFPKKSQAEVTDLLQIRWTKRPSQTVEKSLYGLFPNKIAATLLKIVGIPLSTKANELGSVQKKQLIESLTNFSIKITGTKSWNEAEFTAGGIDTDQVKIQSLESKLIDNLYFAGEILDVDGDVGGFNLSWAWASGNVAGKLL